MLDKKENIVIFGFKDSLLGQFLSISKVQEKYNIKYLISVNKIPTLNIAEEHKKRPNNKTEFVQEGCFLNIPVYTDSRYIDRLIDDEIRKVFVLEDDSDIRYKIIKKLTNAKIEVLSFLHDSVYLGGENNFGIGVIIFPMCYIGYKSDIGDGVIMQSNSVVEHHNTIGNFCDINPRLTTGGFTSIDNFVTIHMSTTIINRIKIGARCRIGAGSLVLKDCEEGFLYFQQ